MTRAFIRSILTLSFLAAPALYAQDAGVLGAGTRVRLATPLLDSAQQIGKVVSATRDSIVYRADANPVTRSLAISDISSIEVSGGMVTHRGRDALYGLMIGGGTGALLGAATYKKPKSCYFLCDTRGFDAALGGAVGGLLGTLVGAFVVANFDKTERWVPLKKSASLQIIPTPRGARVAFSRTF